jgi:hypothetical protein
MLKTEHIMMKESEYHTRDEYLREGTLMHYHQREALLLPFMYFLFFLKLMYLRDRKRQKSSENEK